MSSGTIDALRAALADADAQRQLDAEALAALAEACGELPAVE